MTSIEFKEKWKLDELNRWTDFTFEQLEKTNLNCSTINFLKKGFPEDSAPFLSFGLRSYDWKFYTIFEYYSNCEVDAITKNYLICGADGEGNPICFDTTANDEVVLLDHEQGFGIMQKMNKDIIELSQCLLVYKEFAERIRSEFGEGAFFDSKFTKKHLADLKIRFENIDPNIFEESDFWKNEVENLYFEIN